MRPFEKKIFFNEIDEFIPIAFHYNKETLITKNGHLIQIVRINGIDSKIISKSITNIRQVLKDSLIKNLIDEISCWFHVVRDFTDLSGDILDYENLFCANVYQAWEEKNTWNSRYCNVLYISFVFQCTNLKIKNFKTFSNSLFFDTIKNFHNKYFEYAIEQLNIVVNNIINDLFEFDIKKLSIINENKKSVSELITVYKYLLHLAYKDFLTPIVDASISLSDCKYEIENTNIAIISSTQKKYLSIISLKDYSEIDDKALDILLQFSSNMIMCEIFYLVPKNEIIKKYKYHKYILDLGRDEILKEVSRLDLIDTENSKFGSQQLTISIFDDSIQALNDKLKEISAKLSNLGIVHVVEDIDLESLFWSQLPGNFKYIKRLYYAPITNIAAFTALHNTFPGEKNSVWGKAVTLFETYNKVPYFFNFHVNQNGNTVIIGNQNSGKTTLVNFLLSQASKFKSKIVYFTQKEKSKIFIESLGGRWIEEFAFNVNGYNKDQIIEIIKILINGYNQDFQNQKEIDEINNIVDEIIASNTLTFQGIKNYLLTNNLFFKQKLLYLNNNIYSELFNSNEIEIPNENVIAFNLYKFTDQYFTKKCKPDNPKLMAQFDEELVCFSNVGCLLLKYLFEKFLLLDDFSPKFLILDDILTLLDHNYFSSTINDFFNKVSLKNCVIISTINSNKNFLEDLLINILSYSSTVLCLEIDPYFITKYKNLLNFHKLEINSLKKINFNNRDFFIKQNDEFISANLNLNNFLGISSILSAKPKNLLLYNEIKNNDPENWLISLYDKLNNS